MLYIFLHLKAAFFPLIIFNYKKRIEINQMKDKKLAEFRSQFGFLEELNTRYLLNEVKQTLKKSNIYFFLNYSWLQTLSEIQFTYDKILNKYYKNVGKLKNNWNKQEIQFMGTLILILFSQQPNQIFQVSSYHWNQISKYLYIRTPEEVKLKWMSMNKNAFSESALDQVQDLLFKKILNKTTSDKQNPKWSRIVYEFNKESPYINKIYRSSKVLKKHWIQNLCQVEKGVWRLEQDEFLLKMILQYGKKWSKISKLMKNTRTEYAVKNRYYTIIQKQLKKTLKLVKSQSDQLILIDKILKKIKNKLHNQSQSSINEQISQIDSVRNHQIQTINQNNFTSLDQITRQNKFSQQTKYQYNSFAIVSNSYSNINIINMNNSINNINNMIYGIPISTENCMLQPNYFLSNNQSMEKGQYILYQPILFM